MAKVREVLKDGSKRTLIFDARLEKSGSGRSVSGLVGIHYEVPSTELVKSLSPGKYKLVIQKRTAARWVYVSSEEVTVDLAPS